MKINNRRAGMRPDRTDASSDGEMRDKTGGSTETCNVISFVLYSIYFFFSLFFFSIVYNTATGGAGWDATGPVRAAQQHGTGEGAGELEEEVEGWAAGLRKGRAEASRSGRRLGNIADVLSPPWLRDM